MALRAFGLTVEDASPARPEAAVIAPPRPSTITVLLGPSGSGKSIALDRLATELEGVRIIRADRIRLTSAPAVDHVRGDLEGALRALAGVGLGEARLFARPADALSEGQRERLRLAIALRRAERSGAPAVIIADEFLARLDAPSARALARAVRRAIDRSRSASLLCAGASAPWLDALDPDEVVRLSERGGREDERRARRRAPLPISIRQADLRSYAALSRFHYRAAPPACAVRVLEARSDELPELGPLGALVVAMPTLNAFWRDLAWPGRFTTGDRRRDAARLNGEVRRIARCVVHPGARALGVATALVRAYLRDPLTARTEAVAAMATASPFLEAAGMREHRAPPSRQDARLLDALDHARIEAWRLADPARLLAESTARTARFLERELRRWAADSRRTARAKRADLPALLALAARTVVDRRTACTHTA